MKCFFSILFIYTLSILTIINFDNVDNTFFWIIFFVFGALYYLVDTRRKIIKEASLSKQRTQDKF